MVRISAEDFKKVFKKEKDARVSRRMSAVYSVCYLEIDMAEAARLSMHSENSVRDWAERFEAGGIDALRDLPRSGRRPKVPPKIMEKVRKIVMSMEKITPEQVRQLILHRTKKHLHISVIRKKMRKWNMTRKLPTMFHVNRASRRVKKRWQRRIQGKISRLEGLGYTVLVQDEAIFVHDTESGYKYWSVRGVEIPMTYTGSHKRLVAHGAMTLNGRQCIRTFEKFNSRTFIEYLCELRRLFGKILVIVDKATQHRSSAVRRFLNENKDIKLEYFPTGSPDLNAMEEVWHQAKRDLVVSEYYPTFEEMCRSISEYFRTAARCLDVKKFLYRRLENQLRNF